MLNFFGKRKEQEDIELPDWVKEMQETEQRWKVFLEKMQQRLHELGNDAIPALVEAFKSDKENDTSTYHQMRSSINAQFRNMNEKANNVYDEKINDFYRDKKDEIPHGNIAREMLDDFRTNNQHLLNAFEEQCDEWLNNAAATEYENPEEKYNHIIATYEALKQQCKCSQCGAKIIITKIYFISTYIACTQCQTQNTFDPHSTVKELEWVTRSLAEARTKHLLNASTNAKERERELYHQIHNLKLDINFESDKKKAAIMEAEKKALEAEREQCIIDAPAFYKKYLKEMFDEWYVLMPDMKEQNEKVYEGMLQNYKRGF